MFKWLKRIGLALSLVLLMLAAILAFNTIRYVPQETAVIDTELETADIETATAILSKAVRFNTDSTNTSHPDFGHFLAFLEEMYPTVHASMERELIREKTPLYKWTGSDSSLKPVMFAAHYDVVPAALDSLDRWEKPPFSGDISDGYVWGRGTLDNKGALIAILTSAEQLIKQGFRPKRTVYFSFGHDEEVGGRGALAVALHLRKNNIRLDWILDEGSFVLDKIIPGLDKPVASINLSEKGYLTVKLVARGEGGHSALPPRVTSVGRLAAAIDKLEKSPVPGGLSGVSEEFFDSLGRHFSLGQRVVFANRWLFEPLLERLLSASPPTNAMLRTTTAPTMLIASPKENVLATEAIATINFRLHPRDTIDGIIEHIRHTIDDESIEIQADRDQGSEASPVSSSQADGYRQIEETIRAVFGPLATVPGLTIAATDARHYALAADQAYRINPFKVTGDDIKRFHGINERLSIENLERGVEFYLSLLKRQ